MLIETERSLEYLRRYDEWLEGRVGDTTDFLLEQAKQTMSMVIKQRKEAQRRESIGDTDGVASIWRLCWANQGAVWICCEALEKLGTVRSASELFRTIEAESEAEAK